MNKKLAAVAIAATLLVGGCGTTGNQQFITNVATFEQTIATDARAVCGFLPTISTIAAIITALNAAAAATETLASQIAGQICNAIPPPPAAGRLRAAGACVPYPGTSICIHGRYAVVASL